MKWWAVKRVDGKPKKLTVAYPTKRQADQSASYCSYPVAVVPVEVKPR